MNLMSQIGKKVFKANEGRYKISTEAFGGFKEVKVGKDANFKHDKTKEIKLKEAIKNEIKSVLSDYLKSDSPMIIKPIDKVYEYNDLWRKESLLLEWIWDSLEKNKVKFFPDWYSIFYTNNGIELFFTLNKTNHVWSQDSYNVLDIKKRDYINYNTNSISICSLFPLEIMQKHLAPLDGYFLDRS